MGTTTVFPGHDVDIKNTNTTHVLCVRKSCPRTYMGAGFFSLRLGTQKQLPQSYEELENTIWGHPMGM